jgi:hypothetical protein
MLTLPDIVTVLSENPEAVVALAVILRLVRAYQSQLTWPEYRMIHRFKRGVIPVLYLFTKGKLHLLNDKGGRDDAEFVATTDKSLRAAVRAFQDDGASLHLINSIKRRPDEHGDPLSAAHLIYTVDGDQVEVYLFTNSDGSTDIYAHTEASVDDPLRHLTERQRDGDKHGVLPDAYK